MRGKFVGLCVVLVVLFTVISPTVMGASVDGQSTERGTIAAHGSGGSNHAAIVGTFRYNNSSAELPGRQLTVKLIHDRAVKGPGADPNTKGNLDGVIATTTTNDSGVFEFSFDPTSVGPGNDTRVYVMVIAKNDAAIVTNTAIRMRHGYASQSWRLTRGDVVRPTITPDSDTKHGAFHAADAALTAYRFTKQEVGYTMDRVRIQYPQTNSARYISVAGFKHISIPKKSNDDWGSTTVYHEYGHALLGDQFGGSWRIPHVRTYLNFNEGFFPCHSRPAETGRFYAWSEGFSEFYEAAVAQWNHPNQHADYREQLERGGYVPQGSSQFQRWYNMNYTSKKCLDGHRGDGFDGNEVEGAIASILWDVYDGKNEPTDEINATVRDIVGTLGTDQITVSPSRRNDEKVRTGNEFWHFFRTDANHEALRKVFYVHGIQKPDRFEDNDRATTATHLVPNTSVDAQFQNHFISKSIPSATVPTPSVGTDEDYYTIDLKAEQRVNLTVTTGHWVNNTDVAASLEVTGPAGMQPAVTHDNGSANVTFSANETGNHTVFVDGLQNRAYTGWYTLSVNATPQVPQDYEENDNRSEATPLAMAEIGPYRNTTEVTASTARNDADYYRLDLRRGHRIEHARVRNGPGLNLTLVNETGVVRRVPAGDVLQTTTVPTGPHYLVVDGDARVADYILNVTTQLVSQKYEENDRRAAAADLSPDVGLQTVPQTGSNPRGNTNWCNRNRNGNNVGGGIGGGSTAGGGNGYALGGLCPRHNWHDEGQAGAGYAAHEDDWYELALRKGERVNVTPGDDRLGVEVYRDGSRIANVSPDDWRDSVTFQVTADDKYAFRLTGDVNVSSHFMQIQRFVPAAQDRLEPNDEKATATQLQTGSGGTQVHAYSGLKLAGTDADTFAVSLEQGERVNATMTHRKTGGDLRLSVLGPTSVLGCTASSSRHGCMSSPGTNEIAFEWTARRDGTHYVQVTGSEDVALEYNLTIGTNTSETATPMVPLPPRRTIVAEELAAGQWHTYDIPTPEELAAATWIQEIGLNPEVPTERFEMAVSLRKSVPSGVAPLEPVLDAEGRPYVVVEHEQPFEGQARVRIAVDRETLAAQGTSADAVSIYRHPGPDREGEWTGLETTVAQRGDERVVFGAKAAGLSVYAIGVASNASVYPLFVNNRQAYNENVDQIPGLLRGIVANERIKVEVTHDDGSTERIGVVLDGPSVASIDRGGLDDPTLVVRTSNETIGGIYSSNDPAESAMSALNSDRITYHGVGAVNAVKYTLVKVAVGVLDVVRNLVP